MNRRLRLQDGRHWTIRRANPSPRDSDVAGLGPLDPEIGILRVDRNDGRPLAVLYNFAGHAYGGVPDGSVTADLPGFASAVLEEGHPQPGTEILGECLGQGFNLAGKVAAEGRIAAAGDHDAFAGTLGRFAKPAPDSGVEGLSIGQ